LYLATPAKKFMWCLVKSSDTFKSCERKRNIHENITRKKMQKKKRKYFGKMSHNLLLFSRKSRVHIIYVKRRGREWPEWKMISSFRLKIYSEIYSSEKWHWDEHSHPIKRVRNEIEHEWLDRVRNNFCFPQKKILCSPSLMWNRGSSTSD
jgi:hypothetical protein